MSKKKAPSQKTQRHQIDPSIFLQLTQAMQQPGVHFVFIEHDNGCPGIKNHGNGCICNPSMRLATEAEYMASIGGEK